jgi:hypothetical protein
VVADRSANPLYPVDSVLHFVRIKGELDFKLNRSQDEVAFVSDYLVYMHYLRFGWHVLIFYLHELHFS